MLSMSIKFQFSMNHIVTQFQIYCDKTWLPVLWGSSAALMYRMAFPHCGLNIAELNVSTDTHCGAVPYKRLSLTVSGTCIWMNLYRNIPHYRLSLMVSGTCIWINRCGVILHYGLSLTVSGTCIWINLCRAILHVFLQQEQLWVQTSGLQVKDSVTSHG